MSVSLEMTPLQMLPHGGTGRISELMGDAEHVQRLEELGLRRGVMVEMVSSGSPCIVRIDGARICIRSGDLFSVMVSREGAA